MTSKETVEILRLKIRVSLLENLVLRRAVETRVLGRHQSISEAESELAAWLDETSIDILQEAGKQSENPALTALIGDEAKDITDAMKAIVAKSAADLRKKNLKA